MSDRGDVVVFTESRSTAPLWFAVFGVCAILTFFAIDQRVYPFNRPHLSPSSPDSSNSSIDVRNVNGVKCVRVGAILVCKCGRCS